MQNFTVEVTRTIDTIGDYALVSYRAVATTDNEDLPRQRFVGLVRVSPANSDPADAIRRDIKEQIEFSRKLEKETIEVSIPL